MVKIEKKNGKHIKHTYIFIINLKSITVILEIDKNVKYQQLFSSFFLLYANIVCEQQ